MKTLNAFLGVEKNTERVTKLIVGTYILLNTVTILSEGGDVPQVPQWHNASTYGFTSSCRCMYVCMYVCKTIYKRRIKNKELLKRRSFKRTSKFSAVLGTVQLSCPAVAVWLCGW